MDSADISSEIVRQKRKIESAKEVIALLAKLQAAEGEIAAAQKKGENAKNNER